MAKSEQNKQDYLRKFRNLVLLIALCVVGSYAFWRMFIFRDNSLVLQAAYEMDIGELKQLAQDGYDLGYVAPKRVTRENRAKGMIASLLERVNGLWQECQGTANQFPGENVYSVLRGSEKYLGAPELRRKECDAELAQLVISQLAARRFDGDFVSESLVFVCERGELAFAEKFLEFGADANYRSEKLSNTSMLTGPEMRGLPPLLIAFFNNDIALFEMLLKRGADPDMKNEGSGLTLLHEACIRLRPSYVACLLRYGVNVNRKDDRGQPPLQNLITSSFHDQYPLQYRKNPKVKEVIQLLLSGKCDVEFRDDKGNTVLHLLACRTEKRATAYAGVLLAHGANARARNLRGDTPLQLASESGNRIMAELLSVYAKRSADQEHGSAASDKK